MARPCNNPLPESRSFVYLGGFLSSVLLGMLGILFGSDHLRQVYSEVAVSPKRLAPGQSLVGGRISEFRSSAWSPKVRKEIVLATFALPRSADGPPRRFRLFAHLKPSPLVEDLPRKFILKGGWLNFILLFQVMTLKINKTESSRFHFQKRYQFPGKRDHFRPRDSIMSTNSAATAGFAPFFPTERPEQLLHRDDRRPRPIQFPRAFPVISRFGKKAENEGKLSKNY